MSELRETLINITEEKNAKIIPSNIKEGVQIFDVVGEYKGLDTSDATATTDDIASGKTAYVNGQKISGSVQTIRKNYTSVSQVHSIVPKDVSSEVEILSKYNNNMLFQNGSFVTTKPTYQELAEAINLTSDKILEGQTVLGVEGTVTTLDTSDATAIAGDILEGKTAYINGEKVEGTLASISGVAESTATQVYVPADDSSTLYMDALSDKQGIITTDTTITVKADNELVADAIGLAPDMIRAGANILGIEGTYDSNPEDYNAKFQAPEGVTSGLSPLMMLVSIESLDTSKLTTVTSMFNGCISLKSLPEMDLSNASQGAWMCHNCTNLVYTPVLNMPKMQGTSGMFANCSNISYINLVGLGPRYHSYDNMFRGCANLKEIPNITYNESNSYHNMFRDCKSLTSIDMKGVQTNNSSSTQVQYMCYNCTNLKSFSNFTATAYDSRYSCTTEYMFYNCSNLEKVSNLTLRYCTTTNYMFANCTNLKSLENCSISFGNRGSGQFENCYNLVNAFENGNISISAHYYGISSTFRNCYNLRFNNGYVNAYLYVNGCGIGSTFSNCKSIESADLSVAAYTGDYSIQGFGSIFEGCSNLRTANVKVADSRRATISGTFINCVNLTSVKIDLPDASPLYTVFDGCTSLTNLANCVCNWYRVNNFYRTFANCSGLQDLDTLKSLSPCVEGMFAGCSNLTSLGNFSASNINLMNNMFRDCINLRQVNNLYLSNYSSIGASRIDNAFVNCISLTDLQPFTFTTAFLMNNGEPCMFGSYNAVLNGSILPLSNLTNFGGLINYGISFNSYARTANNARATLDIVAAPNLSYQSLQNVINGVYNLYTAYGIAEGGTLTYPQLIRMANTQYEKLTEDDIGILTSKGWNITVHNIGG